MKQQTAPVKNTREETPPPVLSVTILPRHPRVHGRLQTFTRFLVMLLMVLGANRFVGDALHVQGEWLSLLLSPLFWLAVMALLTHSVKGMIGGLALTLLGFGGIWLTSHINPIRYLASGVAILWNRFMAIIDEMGYLSLAPIGESLPSGEGSLFFVLSMLSCLVAYFSIRKKTRLFPILAYLLLLCSPFLLYNMPEQNDGMALLVASLTGIIVMRLSEKHTTDVRSSGFAGAVSMVLSLLLLLPSVLTVKKPLENIPGIAEIFEELRVIITDLAEGKPPHLSLGDDFESYNKPRNTVANPRVFKGKQILTVYSDTNAPLYLREWVGGDYRNDHWYAPDLTTVDAAYRPHLNSEANPYHVTDNFVKAFEMMINEADCQDLGILRSTVTIVPRALGGLMPLPVTAVSEPYVPSGYEDYPLTYQVHSDYIVSSNRYTRNTPYETLTLQPYRYTTPIFDEFLEAFYHYVQFTKDGIMPPYNTLARRMAMHFGRDGLTNTVNGSLRCDSYVKSLYSDLPSLETIDLVVEELFQTTNIADYYNHSNYESDLEGAKRTGVITVSDENGEAQTYYLSSLGETFYADEIAHIVTDFLGNRCHYTLTPQQAASESAMEEFLLGNREGYCVQFATAATLVLRRLGFAARYAEGYLANDFSVNHNDSYTQSYTAKVRDHDAHAWVEVWVSGFGWKVIEATPGYTEDFYETTDALSPDTAEPTDTQIHGSADITEADDTTRPHISQDPDTTSSVTEKPPVSSNPTDLTSWLTGSLLAFLLASVLLLLLLRSSRHREARERRIRLAKKGTTSAQQRELSMMLAEDCRNALRAYRLIPTVGELPSAFGRRADMTLVTMGLVPPVSRAVEALSHLVYSNRMEEGDLIAMATVTEALIQQAGSRLGLLRFLYYRWILCLI